MFVWLGGLAVDLLVAGTDCWGHFFATRVVGVWCPSCSHGNGAVCPGGQDGALQHAPTITTYKAVDRGSGGEPVQLRRATQNSSTVLRRQKDGETPDEPASLKNIKRLSLNEDVTVPWVDWLQHHHCSVSWLVTTSSLSRQLIGYKIVTVLWVDWLQRHSPVSWLVTTSSLSRKLIGYNIITVLSVDWLQHRHCPVNWLVRTRPV